MQLNDPRSNIEYITKQTLAFHPKPGAISIYRFVRLMQSRNEFTFSDGGRWLLVRLAERKQIHTTELLGQGLRHDTEERSTL